MSYAIRKCKEGYKIFLKAEPITGGAGEGKTGVLGLSDYAKSPNFKSDNFQKQLTSLGLSPDDYIATVKHLAKKYRYDPDKISFSTDGKHKITYDS